MKKNTKKKQQQKTQCEYCKIIFIHGVNVQGGQKFPSSWEVILFVV